MRSLTSLAVISLLAGLGCKTTSTAQSKVASSGGGGYTVSYYTPGSMPVECKTPPGFNFSDGVAVVEGDPLIDGATCSGWSSGLPDCTKTLQEKKLCGTTFKIIYNGNVRRGWLTGICPWDHPNNSAKGQWNPCGRGRKHLDLMDSLYFGLGLGDAQSWGPDQTRSPWQQNPQAAYVEAYKDVKVEGVWTIH